MFTSAKQEYLSAYRDRRVFLGQNYYKGYMYGKPPATRFYDASRKSFGWSDQGESIGYHILRYKLGQITRDQAVRMIKLQYRLNRSILP